MRTRNIVLAVAASILGLLSGAGAHAADRGVHYEILLDRPQTQTVTLCVRLDEVDGPTVELKLPTWRTGKYEVLDQAGDIRWYRARDGAGRELAVEKTDKTTWRIDTGGARSVVMEYEIYANDLGNRTKHVDDTHAFLDAAATMMYSPERRDEPVSVRVRAPDGWDVATGLEPEPGDPTLFVAADYDVLVDSPLEIGEHDRLTFEAAGVPHEIVIWGSDEYDAEALREDFTSIVEAQAEMFGGLPYERYVFMVHATEEAGGATEHLNSTILQTSPRSLTDDERYERWLGTVSHELFHVWNVKLMRPAGISPYDYAAENYTRLLWVAEGTTSYYDDLMLVRAGLREPDDYLEDLADALEREARRPGRHVQSLEQSSFDAWIKFNVPSPDRVNTTVSFYSKGALVSLLLDMAIREASGTEPDLEGASLDDVLSDLFAGTGWGSTGYTPEQFQAAVERRAGRDLDAFFERYVRGTAELEVEGALGVVGLELRRDDDEDQGDEDGDGEEDGDEEDDGEEDDEPDAYLGLDLDRQGAVAAVREDGPAFEAGVQAGDRVLALNGEESTGSELDDLLEDVAPGERIELAVMRRGRLRTLAFDAARRDPAEWTIRRVEAPTGAQRAAYERWLGQPWPEEPEAAVVAVLDDWHAAAAAADRERYVGHLADETVFMGTDATVRWGREAFVEYLTPHFERGDGWTFEPRERRITVAEDGRTAWFDELLDSATYGELRGSGVLIREGEAWKIAQYNLSIPLPNELARDIVEQISAHRALPDTDDPPPSEDPR